MAGTVPETGWVEEPGRRGLWLGILVYRWLAFGWMTVLAAVTSADLRRPELAWAAIGATGAWTLWLTVYRGWERPAARWFDLGLSFALLLVSGVVVDRGVVVADHPFFATAYPVSSAMTWGAARGMRAGIGSGLVLAIGLLASRPINGVPLGDLTLGQVASVGNGIVYYLVAGGAIGLVSGVIRRSGHELRRVTEDSVRHRRRAATLAEREQKAREIHESVLQALAMVNRRGKELAGQVAVSGREVRSLAEMAAQQERALRALVEREPEEPPAGKASLREALQEATVGAGDTPVTVSAPGPLWMPVPDVEELEAVVRRALENVDRHARASHVTVLAERTDGEVVLTVRDDGVGFDYDEERLRRDGKAGLLEGIVAPVESLGGTVTVDTEPGRGTTIQMRLPAAERARGEGGSIAITGPAIAEGP